MATTLAADADAVLARLAMQQSALNALCRANGVQRLGVFGSAVRADFDPATSDLDVIVRLDAPTCAAYFERYFALKEGLERMAGRDADVVTDSSITNPYLRRRIAAEEVTLFAA